MKQAHHLIVLLGVLALSACGGGGGDGGGGGSASYTIGGTVSGLLASSSVVLQDNGGDNLTVQSNGTFTFSQAVSSGAAYAVTVATQPSSQACTVTNGSGSATANVTTVTVACGNAVSVSVGTFPSDVQQDVPNVPTTTVTVCDNGGKCVNVQVLVDTGSSGLRLMSSAVASLSLTPKADTKISGNDLFECAYYADGFAWGGVYTAQIKVGAETASNIPVQVVSTAAPPSNCITDSPGGNNPLNTPDAFSADGVLGVGVAAQDCGTACTTSALYYYSCPSTGGCTSTAMPSEVAATSDEVTNPVTGFTGTGDTNGVILQLPAISASGAATVNGLLIFGIGTQTNNGIGAATILPTTSQPLNQQPVYISTTFNGQSTSGIIDSGSNAFFLPDATPPTLMPTCATSGSQFYCPTSPQNFNATNSSSGNGNTSQVSFQVQSLDSLHATNPTFYAFNDVAGPIAAVNGVQYVDWGLPFFYGRSVYTIIENSSVGGQAYPNGAFAY